MCFGPRLLKLDSDQILVCKEALHVWQLLQFPVQRNSTSTCASGCITVTILGSSMATSWAFGPVLQKRALRKVFGARMQESNGPGVYRRRDSGFRVEGLNLCLSHSVYTYMYIYIYMLEAQNGSQLIIWGLCKYMPHGATGLFWKATQAVCLHSVYTSAITTAIIQEYELDF